MKVCPYCSGVTEDKNAIKCAICGHDITNENEYTADELEDELVKEEVYRKIKKIKNKKIQKRLMISIGVFVVLSLGIVLSIILAPKGYVNVVTTTYTAKVGDQITIALEYGGKIKDKDVQLEIISTNNKTNQVSFRYKIVESTCYINCYMADQLTLKFKAKDNGEQYKYNNVVNIFIIE